MNFVPELETHTCAQRSRERAATSLFALKCLQTLPSHSSSRVGTCSWNFSVLLLSAILPSAQITLQHTLAHADTHTHSEITCSKSSVLTDTLTGYIHTPSDSGARNVFLWPGLQSNARVTNLAVNFQAIPELRLHFVF